MANPPPIVQNAANERRKENRLLQRLALERGRIRLSWRAQRLLEKRMADPANPVKDEVLAKLATLDQGDRDKSLTLRGDPTRPLIIGLAPARDLLAPPDLPQIASPEPPPLVNGNAIIPQRFSLADVAEALRAKREQGHDNS